MSQDMNGTVTVKENGEEKAYVCDISVGIESVFAPERLVVLQMNEDHQKITQNEYVPGQLPEPLVVEEETSYLLVETWKRDGDGQWTVKRSLCQPGDKNICVLYDRGDGICLEDFLTIDWRE